MIESRTKCNKNQLNLITIKKVMHQTSNKGQCYLTTKLQGSCDKTCSHYKAPIQDLTGQN